MNQKRIEEILKKRITNWWFTDKEIEEIAQEIAALFEPKPDESEQSHEANMRYGIPKKDIKPDEKIGAERKRLVDWLLEEVTYTESHQETKVPRFLGLTRDCLERYRDTGELRLFEVDSEDQNISA